MTRVPVAAKWMDSLSRDYCGVRVGDGQAAAVGNLRCGHGDVRTAAEMSSGEVKALEEQYECVVLPVAMGLGHEREEETEDGEGFGDGEDPREEHEEDRREDSPSNAQGLPWPGPLWATGPVG